MREILEELPYITIKARVWKTKDQFVDVLVDGDYDGEYFSYLKWFTNPAGYVATAQLRDPEDSKTYKYLHQMVLPAKKGMWVSFLDGNKLNCRSSNLTYLSPRENITRVVGRGGRNRTHQRTGGVWSTEFRGVSRVGNSVNGVQRFYGKFSAGIRGNHLGVFNTPEEAARAYDAAARMHYGEHAILNFPEEENIMEHPVREKQKDGIYPRCVWCGGEIYMPAVIKYSKGEVGCHTCGKHLPAEYINTSSWRKE